MIMDWTGPITPIGLFLVSHFNFFFIPCGRLSWLPVSFLLHVKIHTIVSYWMNGHNARMRYFTHARLVNAWYGVTIDR